LYGEISLLLVPSQTGKIPHRKEQLGQAHWQEQLGQAHWQEQLGQAHWQEQLGQAIVSGKIRPRIY
jgi:hypothetical protein